MENKLGFFKNFLRIIRLFFTQSKEAKELYLEIGKQRAAYAVLREEYKLIQGWKDQYTHTLNTLTESMKAMIWSKDENNKYTLANPLHCSCFFGIDNTPECLEFIKGKTDLELINYSFHSKNIQNTFGQICVESDNYTRDKKIPCHFIEAGKVDDECVLLYIVKIPRYINNEYVGTLGMGWDFTEMSAFWIKQLNRWSYEGKTVEIYKEKDVFVYAIDPEVKKCDIFRHICPRPQTNEYKEDCNGYCDSCELEQSSEF